MALAGPKSPRPLGLSTFPPLRAGRVRLLIFSDLHFKAKNAEDSKTFADATVRYAQSLPGLSAIVCLGDILDGHQSIHLPSFVRAVKFLKALAEVAPTLALIGNHDREHNTVFLSDESPFLPLKGQANLTVVDSPQPRTFGGLMFLFVPYVPPGTFEKALEGFPLAEATAIFAHQEFRGALAPTQKKSKAGDSWPRSNPLVISGHFHEQQAIRNNIIYVGGAFQHAVNEGPDKGFSVFDFAAGSYRWRFCKDVVEPTLEFTMSAGKLSKFVAPPRGRLRLIIEVRDRSSLEEAENSDKLRKLRERGAKVIYRLRPAQQECNGEAPPVERARFFALLAQAIRGEEKLQALLNEELDQ